MDKTGSGVCEDDDCDCEDEDDDLGQNCPMDETGEVDPPDGQTGRRSEEDQKRRRLDREWREEVGVGDGFWILSWLLLRRKQNRLGARGGGAPMGMDGVNMDRV